MGKIYRYIDYRKLLYDYYTEQKNSTRYFSYRYFADKVGINSPGFIKDVISGKRNLTNTVAVKFAKALGLTKKETTFFHNLVMFNQAKSAEEKQEHYRIVVSMMNLVSEFELNTDQYSYFDKWYTCVIRELVCMYDFKNNYSLLAKMLNPTIKKKEAQEAAQLLLRLKLIKKHKDGTYVQTNSALTSGHDHTGMIMQARRSFNRKMVEHALCTLDTMPTNKRNISGITMGLSESGYEIMLAELAAFKERIITIANQDKDLSGVYQFNFQLFPISEDISRVNEIKKEQEK